MSHNTIECVLAADAIASVEANAGKALHHLSTFSAGKNDWLFGHLAYDLKNEIESLNSNNFDGIGFPDLFFFVPRYVLQLNETSVSIGSLQEDQKDIYDEIINTEVSRPSTQDSSVRIVNRVTKSEYLATVEHLRQHILRGDCYEINYCQEFYSDNVTIDPLHLYLALSDESPNPFSAYYKLHHRYLACLSPERYLKKEGTKILSQPIKGTSRRVITDVQLDQQNVANLRHNEKERAENIMVVDLVRNDLSKICAKGSVQVDELCEVYTFPQVHQMISTVSGTIRNDVGLTDAVAATFPMGSMTGAPKKKVMELIEIYEQTRRGLFSGSIGYVTPQNDFDFNVVIRSAIYNSSARYLSFHTGSAITFNSDAEKEYEECLLKAGAIKKALAETNTFH